MRTQTNQYPGENRLTLTTGGASIALEIAPTQRDEIFTLEEPEAGEEIDYRFHSPAPGTSRSPAYTGKTCSESASGRA